LYDLEPDRSITGGAWYSDQDFESEFVEILNQQCHRFLRERLEKAGKKAASLGPLATRSAAAAPSSDVLKYITDLQISKVQLKTEDIEAILDTLVYDGRAERAGPGHYRARDPMLPPTGLMRSPCGGCPIVAECEPEGEVNPARCIYFKDWLM